MRVVDIVRKLKAIAFKSSIDAPIPILINKNFRVLMLVLHTQLLEKNLPNNYDHVLTKWFEMDF